MSASIGQKGIIVKRGKVGYTWGRVITYAHMAEALYPIKLYLKYRPNIVMLPISLALNVASWFWLLVNIPPQEDQLFLHYTILFGVDLIGTWGKIFYLPLTGLLILLVNAAIGWLLFKSSKFFAQILNTVGLVCQLFILVATWLIVFLNV